VSCPRVLRVDDKDVLRYLLSSAAAAERERHRGDPGLEEKSFYAIYPFSAQQALCILEPLM
jgi:hypothetical protein